MPGKAVVIDANILVRAVLGKRVREVIETYAAQVSFFVPEVGRTLKPKSTCRTSSSNAVVIQKRPSSSSAL